ncbi:hypothetical protein EW026_g16 [Hermanssonia centrifuga]|uniref:GH16 domain-containing protein n=1 Tax=Hermanssonia centrifuga TaxID=98765 RepID=A0A4S4KVN6_9APHY|nr:hypothetical protein EW026_g16 [Hermanssonia centrifuga]
MFSQLPLAVFSMMIPAIFHRPSRFSYSSQWCIGLLPLLLQPVIVHATILDSRSQTLASTNGTTSVWIIEDTYAGETFFDTFDFFTGPDPTHGTVNYTTEEFAFANGLAFVTDNIVYMKGDNTTWLAPNVNRNSVRISSQKQYNTGLFILDANKAPWGCGVWPAWWTLGGGQWPYTGEIDIIEGVHDNEHNQVTWHTGPSACANANFTGSIVTTNGQPNLVCDGGGVFAMKWDDEGIAVWSFYRAAVPQDIIDGVPSPSSWGIPVAVLEPSGCDPITNFVNHSIVFDITFCGDWAGNSYATSGCPGTCPDHLQDPSNFDDAEWSINTLKVYKKVTLQGPAVNAAEHLIFETARWTSWVLIPVIIVGIFWV